ncbi:hypothetical protein F4604DRAFT_1898515 [Suillus subluteus]|nr:hypothetical protein F4604DRAFT_1898515 [Suillus subluteus]
MQSSSSFTGVYSITSKDNPGVLYWGNPSNNSVMLGALVPWNHAITVSDSAIAFMQLWLVEKPPPTTPSVIVYTMRNLSNGKYLGTLKGSTVITNKPASNTSDHWIIAPHPSGNYRITNKRFKNKSIGYKANTIDIILGSGSNERWDFKKVSISSTDITTMLKGYTWPITSQMYLMDEEYIVLSQGMLREIWNRMKKHSYRREIYDETDLAIAFKSAVAKWGVQSVLKDATDVPGGVRDSKNIAFFCAFMAAGPNPRAHTLNSYIMTLSTDHKQLLFMNPQNGRFEKPSSVNQNRQFLGIA